MTNQVEIRFLNLPELDSKERIEFRNFTQVDFYDCLRGVAPLKMPVTGVFGIAAFIKDKTVGLLLGSYQEANFKGRIYSIFVKEEFRRQKIATQLFQTVEKFLKEKKCVVVEKKYCAEAPYTEALERLFQSCEWRDPDPLLTQYWFDQTFGPDWIKTTPPLPEGFQEFNWKQLKPEEEKILRHQRDQLRFPLEVSPFGRVHQIEYLNSLGLRHKGEVIGWMITHRIYPDTIRFSALYIDPMYRNGPFAIRMLADACMKHHAVMPSIPWALFEVAEEEAEPIWENFVKKRLAPHAVKTVRYNMAWKAFIKM